MALTKTSIRTDVVTRLKAASTLAGPRVTDTRLSPQQRDEELPRIDVFIRTSSDESLSISRPAYRHEDRVVIQAWARAVSDADLAATLDTLGRQIRHALLKDADWVRQFERLGNVEESCGLDLDADDRRGMVQVVIPVRYTEVLEPTVADAFSTVHIETDLIEPSAPGPDGTTEVVSEVNL